MGAGAASASPHGGVSVPCAKAVRFAAGPAADAVVTDAAVTDAAVTAAAVTAAAVTAAAVTDAAVTDAAVTDAAGAPRAPTPLSATPPAGATADASRGALQRQLADAVKGTMGQVLHGWGCSPLPTAAANEAMHAHTPGRERAAAAAAAAATPATIGAGARAAVERPNAGDGGGAGGSGLPALCEVLRRVVAAVPKVRSAYGSSADLPPIAPLLRSLEATLSEAAGVAGGRAVGGW